METYTNRTGLIAVVIEEEIILPNGRVLALEVAEHAWAESSLEVDFTKLTPIQNQIVQQKIAELDGVSNRINTQIATKKAAKESAEKARQELICNKKAAVALVNQYGENGVLENTPPHLVNLVKNHLRTLQYTREWRRKMDRLINNTPWI